jgi:hypothetical protein
VRYGCWHTNIYIWHRRLDIPCRKSTYYIVCWLTTLYCMTYDIVCYLFSFKLWHMISLVNTCNIVSIHGPTNHKLHVFLVTYDIVGHHTRYRRGTYDICKNLWCQTYDVVGSTYDVVHLPCCKYCRYDIMMAYNIVGVTHDVVVTDLRYCRWPKR